jgi:RNA polymerase sigma-70 factor (ECF subfamily)
LNVSSSFSTDTPAIDSARFARGLLHRIAEGDAEALRLLYDLYVDRIHGIVSRIVADSQDVREIVQDTFVKAWRQAGTYRHERGEVFAWLALIARNTAIDRIRAGKRRREILVQYAGDPSAEPPPASGTLDHRDFVVRTLAQLEHSQRRALELAFFGGCSHAEVAQHLEVPVTTVKNLLHRGMLRLREIARRHE